LSQEGVGVAYSLDLRERVVEFVEEGGSRVEAAARFKVSLWCVKDWLKRKSARETRSSRLMEIES